MTFFELEKECKKRKIKFILSIITVIVLILSISFYFFSLRNKTDHVKKIKNKEINYTKKADKQIKQAINKKTEILKPIIDLNINNSNKNKKVKKENKIIKSEFNKSQKSILATSELPSFETSIKLAEKYFKNGEYEKALKWAKNANLQNKKDPRSWIIVSLSLYKLGKKEKAIQILQIYYNYTKNKDILKLIERMKNDEI
jgi:tetratricopeptide (TPR) repeat protein